MTETASASVYGARDGVASDEECAGAAPAILPGDNVGRYTVKALLGAGGMGQVFIALDSELARTVALKIIHPDRGARSPRARSRLLREAQALARLQHRNVVTVFDVGTQGDEVFLAMELIDGQPLSDWLASEVRDWRAVRDAFLAAGRGLAAAHAVGIVHRDFKPSNVIVGKDRVVVIDFGLARATGEGHERPAAGSGEQVLHTSLTLTGEHVGTPLYMSPEQYAGGTVSPQSDQYAFCVALYVALCRRQPLSAGSVAALVSAARGGPAAPPLTKGVPRFLAAVIARGMHADAAQRYPSMDALLADLGRDPARTARRAAGVGLVAAIAVAGWLALAARPSDATRCAAVGDAGATWDDAARGRVAAAFQKTGRAYADDTFRRVDDALRARLGAVAATHRDICEATHVRHEQSDTMLDLRMRCLGRARTEIASLVSLLEEADGPALDRAVAAALGAGDLEACSDTRGLAAAVPPPRDAATAGKVEGLRQELAALAALGALGKWKEGVARGHELVARARALGYVPVVAAALLHTARFEMDAGAADSAVANLYESVETGAVAGDDDLVAEATAHLVHALGARQHRLDAAEVAYHLAVAATGRAGNTPRRLARLYRFRGNLLRLRGDFPGALAMHQMVLILRRVVYGAESPEVALLTLECGDDAEAMGETELARTYYEHALAVGERVLGPRHPQFARVIRNFGINRVDAFDLEAAVPLLERSLALHESALGADHFRVADVLYPLALARTLQLRLPEARALTERAMASYRAAFGEQHGGVALGYDISAMIALREDHADRGHELAQQAIAIKTKVLGLQHADTATSIAIDAAQLVALGRLDEARAAAEQALEIFKTAVGEDKGLYGSGLAVLGDVRLADGRASEALAAYERSLALLEKSYGAASFGLRQPLHGLADARLETGDARGALAAAERARGVAQGGPPGAVAAAELRIGAARWALGDDRPAALAAIRAARSELLRVSFPEFETAAVERWLARAIPR